MSDEKTMYEAVTEQAQKELDASVLDVLLYTQGEAPKDCPVIHQILELKGVVWEEHPAGTPSTWEPKPITNPVTMEMRLPNGKSITATIDVSDLAALPVGDVTGAT